MLNKEECKEFYGVMKITPKGMIVPEFEREAHWKHNSEKKCWVAEGVEYNEDVCTIKENTVEEFIKAFKKFDTGEVTQTFTNGFCYWFAVILHIRFPDSQIMYYEVGNHFACKICNRIYDITGDITSKNLFWENWVNYIDSMPKQKIADIMESTIMKV